MWIKFGIFGNQEKGIEDTYIKHEQKITIQVLAVCKSAHSQLCQTAGSGLDQQSPQTWKWSAVFQTTLSDRRHSMLSLFFSLSFTLPHPQVHINSKHSSQLYPAVVSLLWSFFYQLCKCRPCLSELDCNQHAAVMKCPILLDAERKPGRENQLAPL